MPFRFILPILLFTLDLPAQKHDYQWILGFDRGGTPLTPGYGLVWFDFLQPNHPKMTLLPKSDMYFSTTNTSISNWEGELVAYTNGMKIFNRENNLMPNGDTINPDYRRLGEADPQNTLILPFFNKKNHYFIVNKQVDIYGGIFVGSPKIFSGEFSMDDSKGKVIRKGTVVIEDTIEAGRVTAVKHANGRDWWILQPEISTNRFYRFLFTPEGLRLIGTQTIGIPVEEGLGQVTYTPDGSKYIRVKNTRLNEPAQVDIYDFDRCTGLLSNQLTIIRDYEGFKFGIGVSCSPDSRYLYVMQAIYAYQYDLLAPEIAATETVIGMHDGFRSMSYPDYFWLGQLAPDGRIYVGTVNTGRHLSYIKHPTRAGTACEFVPHGIYMGVANHGGMPNHPNYRLGPLDGSPCDTLGLDNHPLANFRWEHEDSTDIHQVTFTDLSAYEPASWQWTFGDGNSSTERYPIHRYAQNGVYTACLVVKNQFSSDTFCQKVYIGVTAQDNPEIQNRIEVWPNPFSERLVLAFSTPSLRSPVLRLYDVAGRLVLTERLEYGINEINTSGLEKGLYFWAVEAAQERIKTGKVVKM